ncbi:hypothetical protein PJWF_00050 [Achromobacter phage JWF]|uniref:hypothetical protein n=1 Tax=Achromobacter phage JWF TaxID=1589748 RepID=UPI000588E440|nr:hypothetical protein AXJ13_gp050 [Achromobacter phage JWF]AJD82944.1 hypothetical protein PJWF_00050 [Achromobacter phage JWF]
MSTGKNSRTTEDRPRHGTLRYTDQKTGQVSTAAPGTVWFSTYTMIAQEYWDSKEQKWVDLYKD